MRIVNRTTDRSRTTVEVGDYVDRRSRNTTTNTATPIVRNTAVMAASSITSGSDARGERHEALMTCAAVR